QPREDRARSRWQLGARAPRINAQDELARRHIRDRGRPPYRRHSVSAHSRATAPRTPAMKSSASYSTRLFAPENLGGRVDAPRSERIAGIHGRVLALRRRLRISETTWLFLLAALSGVLAAAGSIVF